MITYLVEDRGIPVDSSDELGATPIYYACEYHPSSHNPHKEQEVVSHLLSLGAKVQIRFSSSLDDSSLVDVDTALDYAIIRGNIEAAKRLAMVEDCLWFIPYGCSGPRLSLLRRLFTPSGDAHENYWDLTLDSLAAISEDLIRQTKQTHRPEYAALQYELQSTFLLVCQLSCKLDRDCVDILRPLVEALDLDDAVTLQQAPPSLDFIRWSYLERKDLWGAACPPMMHYDKERHELSGSSLGMLALCVTIGAMDWEHQKRALTTLDRLMTWGANPIGMRDTDPDPSLTPFVYLMKKLMVSNLRENEPLPAPLGSVGPLYPTSCARGSVVPIRKG
ncbi:hypothetical protein BDP81DRAFT_119497 [Colletotrichum phormii]|uniref:Ankyrin repeat protein n=1 Tax=Colletotrichum phormii TaxID=359342 RepID=A0AAJ0EBF1_9PEZI|nr:uncharacterized protein BDP81DRAFT_119497 [Colletotrichum phormii]KAK1623597.1 hypothetical protein BDP81DRAFT_119497 [Colletotrichum phormii]